MDLISHILQSPILAIGMLIGIVITAIIFLVTEDSTEEKTIDNTKLIQYIRHCQKLPPG